MNNNPLTFLKRYALLHVALVVALVAVLLPQPFAILGALVYLPVLALGACCTVLGLRHLFFRNTMDDDAHSGWFIAQWKNLPADKRILFNLVTLIGMFIGVCLIAAALIR